MSICWAKYKRTKFSDTVTFLCWRDRRSYLKKRAVLWRRMVNILRRELWNFKRLMLSEMCFLICIFQILTKVKMLQRSLCRRCLDKMRIPAHRMNLSGQARWLHINSQKIFKSWNVCFAQPDYACLWPSSKVTSERKSSGKQRSWKVRLSERRGTIFDLWVNKSPSRRWVTGWRTEFWMLLGEWRWRSTSAVGGGGFSKHWFSDAGAICIVQVGH